jgi:hypothetical protein
MSQHQGTEHFYPEDKGKMLAPTYTTKRTHNAEDNNRHLHCRENISSNISGHEVEAHITESRFSF